jgi:CO/xanthine dehydrogenase Mo-binding subunit
MLRTPDNVALKDPKDYRLIGTPAKRLDAADKVNGKATFGIDAKVPGMKVAAVAACPVIGGKVARVDDNKAKAVKGVLRTIQLANAVAVVADHMGAARKGLAALDIVWEGGNAHFSTDQLAVQLANAANKPAVIAKQAGDVAKAMKIAAQTVEAVYQLPCWRTPRWSPSTARRVYTKAAATFGSALKSLLAPKQLRPPPPVCHWRKSGSTTTCSAADLAVGLKSTMSLKLCK